MIIPNDIVGIVDTLINREEQPCLADKEAAWEISPQLPHKRETEACKLRLLPFLPCFFKFCFSVSQVAWKNKKNQNCPFFSSITSLPPALQLSGINCTYDTRRYQWEFHL